ncbi:spermine oxidase-like isoform X1 [Aphidius gifuensis]|uniref:spermine oxidase-like isoform X1 n=1 Tax=Aphidius gifuensis TaxID=684658 RepID=UPI001CDD4461|nr:spermine oxidase-like isoform X1 [Aphidius gifuensis]
MVNSEKIIIIGAGAAGISAGCHLYKHGFKNLTILEAKNRIGGRINTVEFGDNVVELGAQWVHGEKGNIVHKLAQPLGLLESSYNLNDFNKNTFVNSQGVVMPKSESAEVWKFYYMINDKAEEDLKDAIGSYGDYFIKEFYKYLNDNKFTDDTRAKEYLDWMEKFDNSMQCSDTWFEVSARGLSDYWLCEGDHLLNWKDRGYKTVFDLLMHRYPDASQSIPILDTVKFSNEVSSIDYSTDKVTVTTTNGNKFIADSVIFTASLGVLKDQHLSLFKPQLSNKKILSIEGLGIGSVNKLFLEFPHRWWLEDSAGFGFIWTEQDKKEFLEKQPKNLHWLIDVFSFFTVDCQPRVLCGWITGESSRFIETLSDDEVKDGLCDLLDKFLGKHYNIPAPDKFIRSKWYTDKHFRGCYSHQSIKTDQLGASARDLAEPILSKLNNKPVILFAGEATHDHYYSTVHGAVESGIREADRLIAYHRQVSKNDDKQVAEKTTLAIIGAGLAGLSAAKTLEEHKFYDYILLEAQDYIGGRIKSIAWNDNWIEEGAQFLHGDNSTFGKICHENNLIADTESGEGEGLYITSDGRHIDKQSIQMIDDLVRDTLEDCEKYVDEIDEKIPESIGHVLRNAMDNFMNDKNNSKEFSEIIYDWNVRYLLIDNSCDKLEDLSAKNWGKFRFVGGPEHLIFNNGYSSSVNMISDSLKNKVRLKSLVKQIKWQTNDEKKNPITLVMNDKKIIADCVLVTSSLGYLKENPDMFIPHLPDDLRMAIDSLGFGVMNKILLDFGKPWWDPGFEGIQFLWHEENENSDDSIKLAPWTRYLTGFDVLQNQETVLLGWVGGKGAKIIEDLSEQEVANDCIDVLRFFMKKNTLPAPKRCKRSQWGQNKFIKGSYSHISTKCDENFVSPRSLARPIWGTIIQNNKPKNVPVVMFAGEATSEHYYSTTHGAFDSGKNQALEFLRHHVGFLHQVHVGDN